MIEPGVIHIEAHLSEGTGIVIYNSQVLNSDKVMALEAERAKSWPAMLQGDLPVNAAR